MQNPRDRLVEFSGVDQLLSNLGLSGSLGQQIGCAVVLAGNVEYHLEQAIWRLEGHNPKGARHHADSKQPTDLLRVMYRLADGVQPTEAGQALRLWCECAWHALQCRHSIVHGVSVPILPAISFVRNPRWNGEDRKRDPATFWADTEGLTMLIDVFAVLLRVIAGTAHAPELSMLAERKTHDGLRTARSVSWELSQANTPSDLRVSS